jgi:hypothetical protein
MRELEAKYGLRKVDIGVGPRSIYIGENLANHSRVTTSKLFEALSDEADLLALRFSLGSTPPRSSLRSSSRPSRASLRLTSG